MRWTGRETRKNTKRVVKRAVVLFREFLGDENSDFETFTKTELNKTLRSFFAYVRKSDGGEMKTTSLVRVFVT